MKSRLFTQFESAASLALIMCYFPNAQLCVAGTKTVSSTSSGAAFYVPGTVGGTSPSRNHSSIVMANPDLLRTWAFSLTP